MEEQRCHCVGPQYVEENTDRLGMDYRSFDVPNPVPGTFGGTWDVCQRKCEGDKTCHAWTYAKPGIQGRSWSPPDTLERSRCEIRQELTRSHAKASNVIVKCSLSRNEIMRSPETIIIRTRKFPACALSVPADDHPAR
ncbi:PAN domain-containing protein [Pseudoduganella sp. R-31]|uniref:PAN domain-containing protein n=1 Tax=Pseudoduganella sp. R-31 TaxID=3404060 RepID=UPI003CF716B3